MTETVEQAVRRLRVVVGGLIAGLLAFAGLAYVLGPLNATDPDLRRFMLILIAAAAAFGATGYGVLRGAMMRTLSGRASELQQAADPGSLVVKPYRAFVVAGGGLIEGPGFLAGIAYLLTHDAYALSALGVAVALLLVHLPSASAVQRIADAAAGRG